MGQDTLNNHGRTSSPYEASNARPSVGRSKRPQAHRRNEQLYVVPDLPSDTPSDLPKYDVDTTWAQGDSSGDQYLSEDDYAAYSAYGAYGAGNVIPMRSRQQAATQTATQTAAQTNTPSSSSANATYQPRSQTRPQSRPRPQAQPQSRPRPERRTQDRAEQRVQRAERASENAERRKLRLREETVRRGRRPMTAGQIAITAASSAIIVGMAIAILYPPSQGLYSAMRTKQFHEAQLAQLQADNQRMQSRVESLQSREGIEDEAQSKYGYVHADEQLGRVVTSGSTSTATTTTGDVEGDQSTDTTTGESDWATSLLDRVFGVEAPQTESASTVTADQIKSISPNAIVEDTVSDAADTAETVGTTDATGDTTDAADARIGDGDATDSDTTATDADAAEDIATNPDADIVVE